MVGGGRGGVGFCEVGMVSVELVCEGKRGREMVRGGRECGAWGCSGRVGGGRDGCTCPCTIVGVVL